MIDKLKNRFRSWLGIDVLTKETLLLKDENEKLRRYIKTIKTELGNKQIATDKKLKISSELFAKELALKADRDTTRQLWDKLIWLENNKYLPETMLKEIQEFVRNHHHDSLYQRK